LGVEEVAKMVDDEVRGKLSLPPDMEKCVSDFILNNVLTVLDKDKWEFRGLYSDDYPFRGPFMKTPEGVTKRVLHIAVRCLKTNDSPVILIFPVSNIGKLWKDALATDACLIGDVKGLIRILQNVIDKCPFVTSGEYDGFDFCADDEAELASGLTRMAANLQSILMSNTRTCWENHTLFDIIQKFKSSATGNPHVRKISYNKGAPDVGRKSRNQARSRDKKQKRPTQKP
jgi:hypothetical protein